jgi:hypothetical protein
VEGWIAAIVGLLTASAAALAFVLRWGWRILRRTQDFLDDWGGCEARPGVPARPGVMSRLHSIEQIGAGLQSEMRLNGGNSLRDVVQKTSQDMTVLKRDVANLRNEIGTK